MNKKNVFLSLALGLVLMACGSSNETLRDDFISMEEYNKVVAERDYYKEQYEKNNNDKPPSGYSGETQMIIDVNPENFGNYFEFILIDMEEKDSFSGEEMYVFVPKSKVFDDGWVYIDVSDDFSLTCTISEKQVDQEWGETGLRKIERLNNICVESDNPRFELIDVKGQILFERIESLQKYEIDTFGLKRIVKTSEGKSYRTDLLRNQLEINY